MEGKAFIFSAPSGSGKTTIVKHLLNKFPFLSFSVSATNRPPRGQEVDGKDYYFLSKEDFDRLINQDGFVEYEEVYEGRYYGTLKKELERIWSEGKHVVFDVDVIGGANLKRQLGKKAFAIFVKVPDISILEDRLKSRGTEDQEQLKKRLDKAKEEMTYESKFDHSLINDQLEQTLLQAEGLVKDFIDS